jgi:hypothetical protein
MNRIVRSMFYLGCAAGMLVYALPRLELGQGPGVPALFGIVWVGMALLIIAAHLRVVLRVDEPDEASSRLQE